MSLGQSKCGFVELVENVWDVKARSESAVFEFDDEELVQHVCKPEHELAPLLTEQAARGAPASPESLKLLQVVRSAKDVVAGTGEQQVPTLALWLAAVGVQGVRLRRGTGSSDPTKYLHTLRHSFIVVQSAEGDLLVDPFFREQFELPVATPAYRAFLSNSVPEVFVGRCSDLDLLLGAISAAIASTCAHMGVPVPPWRSSSALRSKWVPPRFEDRPITADEVHEAGPQLRRIALAVAASVVHKFPAPVKAAVAAGSAAGTGVLATWTKKKGHLRHPGITLSQR